MLRRDDELRLSPATQARYAAVGDDGDAKSRITDQVQAQVATEFGFGDNVTEGVDLMRSASYLFPHDEEIRQTTHYLRNNIHRVCPLQLGEKVPLDLPIHEFVLPGRCVTPEQLASGVTLKSVTLGQVLAASAPRPTLIAAGSHT